MSQQRAIRRNKRFREYALQAEADDAREYAELVGPLMRERNSLLQKHFERGGLNQDEGRRLQEIRDALDDIDRERWPVNNG